MYSVVIPVYRNADSLPELLQELGALAENMLRRFNIQLEVVFVVDASPDDSFRILAQTLPSAPFASQLLLHSRNFGSFAAIRSGFDVARGDILGVMAADLQEPTELQEEFAARLITGTSDVVVGTRASREDPAFTRFASWVFWGAYRYLVNSEIPKGGVDVFGCTRQFRDQLMELKESNSSLIGLIYWLGFRRSEVTYHRRIRKHGKSAWSFRRKLAYMMDSVYSFTDLPVRVLVGAGAVGLVVASAGGVLILASRLFGGIEVPGYTAQMLALLFFGALNTFGLGIIGTYTWRAFENTKKRPLAIVMSRKSLPDPNANAYQMSDAP
jgi:glycosyltransferase involved in cell wall biosynthesis